MTVKLWAVDRLHLCFDYHSESNSWSFSTFFKMLFISSFLFMKNNLIQVFKNRMNETRIKCFCVQADSLFFLLMFCMFRYSYNKNIYKLTPKWRHSNILKV